VQYTAEVYYDNSLIYTPLQTLDEAPFIFFVFGLIFCALFTVELGLRWAAIGPINFLNCRSEEIWWNVLDVIVVGSSCIEVIMDIVARATGTEKSDALQNVSVLRVLRVVRIVRVVRVIRVMRFFRELRMMIFSILGCVKNLCWVMVVLGMTFYMFGVAFTSATIDYLSTVAMWQDDAHGDLIASFGTIDKSILSLFMSMTGGNDWSAYYVPLIVLPVYYRFFFLIFIAFALFAVVNIVTGVFVESALQANLKDRDIVVHEELENKKDYLQSMQDLFNEMDEEGNGTISLFEFEDKLKDERVIAYFNVMKLDVSDARTLFQLLDYDHSDEVGINEFLDGCYKLQGESRALDMKILQFEVQYCQVSLKEIVENIATITKSITGISTSKPALDKKQEAMNGMKTWAKPTGENPLIALQQSINASTAGGSQANATIPGQPLDEADEDV